MPLASQCLGYLNRASLVHRKLDHQALSSSRRTLLVPAGTRRTVIPGDSKRRVLQLARSHNPRGQDHRLGSSAAARCQPEHPQHQHDRGDLNANNHEEESSLLPNYASTDKQIALGFTPLPSELDTVTTWVQQLASAQRTHGNDGVLRVWSNLARSKCLSEMSGSEAAWIRTTILDASLASDRHLERIYDYAQRLLDTHSVHWPHLYETIVLYCLRRRQYRRAFSWHMRLMPSFGPGLDDFSRLIQSQVGDPDAVVQSTLKSMYMTSLHRNLYDSIIPHLYELGHSNLCIQWRDTFLRYHDVPRPVAASQPFLRFLTNYYSNKTLCLEEQVVAGLVSASRSFQTDLSLWEALSADHEHEVGGKGRRFNDTIGARWFASAWIPLDFAIHAVHGLGVRVLGPLSLQSIALREKTTVAIVSRLRQLQKLNIGIGYSTYARAVRNFAEKGDDSLMSALLESDFHPDVFDDMETQQKILRAALEDGDWQTYQLFLAIQPAVAQDSIESTSNHLLQEHLKHQNNQRALALLDDMRAMNIDVTHPTMQVVHDHLIRGLPRPRNSSPDHGRQISEIVAIATRLAACQKFLSSTFWERALFRLGEAGRLVELERLTTSIVGHYQGHATHMKGLVSIHRSDSPIALPDDAFLEIPTDLPIAHDWHPIRRIFVNRVLQAAIIRWGFQKGLNASPRGQSFPSTPEAGPSEFRVARGVRLLRELRNHGIPIEVALVRAEVLHCLARYCARGRGQSSNSGWKNQDLASMRELFNQAYGGQLLPKPLELRDLVNQTERQLPRHTKTFTSIPGWNRRRGN